MNFWNFIYSEEELSKFSQKVLNPLKDNEAYVALTCSRHKYIKDKTFKMKNTDVLDRKVISSTETKEFSRRIMGLGIPEGYYENPDGLAYPYESFVVYVTVNPRDMLKATYNSINNFTKLLYDSHVAKSEIQKSQRLDTVLMSEIQGSTGTKYYLDIDIDVKDKELAKSYVNRLVCLMGTAKLTPIETRGGFHVLIHKDTIPEEIKHSFYKSIQNMASECRKENHGDIEFKPDSMVPCPGTIQGGFEVKVRDINEFF